MMRFIYPHFQRYSCYCDVDCIDYEGCRCADATTICPSSLGTCSGAPCGGIYAARSGTCACDDDCFAYIDCCDDKLPNRPLAHTRDGAFGFQSVADGASCWCDGACTSMGDCCRNASSFCTTEYYEYARKLEGSSRSVPAAEATRAAAHTRSSSRMVPPVVVTQPVPPLPLPKMAMPSVPAPSAGATHNGHPYCSWSNPLSRG